MSRFRNANVGELAIKLTDYVAKLRQTIVVVNRSFICHFMKFPFSTHFNKELNTIEIQKHTACFNIYF